VINDGHKEADIISPSVYHMSFFSHHFNETVCVVTMRTYQLVLALSFLNRSFHLHFLLKWASLIIFFSALDNPFSAYTQIKVQNFFCAQRFNAKSYRNGLDKYGPT